MAFAGRGLGETCIFRSIGVSCGDVKKNERTSSAATARRAPAARRRSERDGRAVDAKIERMVRRIVRQFKPASVVLFGSRARGDADADSDIDLLVVMPFQGSRLRMRVEIRMALMGIRWPKDIVLATPEEVESAPLIPGSIVRSALEEGKVLYARPR